MTSAAMSTPPKSHEEYLESVSEPQRAALKVLRDRIAQAVPGATEGSSYGLPAFLYRGKPLAAFSATRTHCGFYPMSGSIISQFAEELAGFETSKGTIRFQPDRPIPASLLKKILEARKREIG